jgi:hypothetical protein
MADLAGLGSRHRHRASHLMGVNRLCGLGLDAGQQDADRHSSLGRRLGCRSVDLSHCVSPGGALLRGHVIEKGGQAAPPSGGVVERSRVSDIQERLSTQGLGRASIGDPVLVELEHLLGALHDDNGAGNTGCQCRWSGDRREHCYGGASGECSHLEDLVGETADSGGPLVPAELDREFLPQKVVLVLWARRGWEAARHTPPILRGGASCGCGVFRLAPHAQSVPRHAVQVKRQ